MAMVIDVQSLSPCFMEKFDKKKSHEKNRQG